MIISKHNLSLWQLIKNDSKIPVLNNLHIAEDGSTVARNGKSLVVLSPVVEEIKENLKTLFKNQPLNQSISVSSELIKKVFDSIKQDKKFNGLLEHCDIEVNGTEVIFIFTDGIQQSEMKGKIYNREYIDYKANLNEALSNLTSNRIILDLNRLLSLLTTIHKIIPDNGGGEVPIFIEFTKKNDIIIRAINFKTGQRIIALMTSYIIEDKWLSLDDWENQFVTKKNKFTKKNKIKIKKR
jgi:hypothetical protein